MENYRKKIQSVIPFIDKAFTIGTYENYSLVWFLTINNIFVTVIAFLELFKIDTPDFVQATEFAIGLIFLLEFILRTIFIHVPNKTFFTTGNILNLLVIASLLAPILTGNLAIIRFFRLIRIISKVQDMRDIKKRRKRSKKEHEKLKRFKAWLS